ncbi:hypothetical protein [Butyrivibrio sp. WCD2001]|nr:hypothetical protein [Butyrivibrio sp. WCD2001]
MIYPGDYDEDVITITYEGQEPQKISDSEERALFFRGNTRTGRHTMETI